MSVVAKLRSGLLGLALVGVTAFGMAPAPASAVTVLPVVDATGGGAFDGGFINLLSDDLFVLGALLGGDGTITYHTYVDPLAGEGTAIATLFLEPLAGASSAIVTWGGGAPVDLTLGTQVVLSAVFPTAGIGSALDFVIAWTGAGGTPQFPQGHPYFSGNIVGSVPIPPAIALFAPLIAATGAGSWLRRRRQARSGATA